jgi:hypothetical protein
MSQFSALSTSGFIKSGTIQITADTLKVNESQFEANTGAENGGGIIFTGKVGEFTNGSTIQSSAFGPGNVARSRSRQPNVSRLQILPIPM